MANIWTEIEIIRLLRNRLNWNQMNENSFGGATEQQKHDRIASQINAY